MLKVKDLDDRRYQDILEEAKKRIPYVCPEWTDHNPQDTGIMLLEQLAAMTEMQNYYLNQIWDKQLDAYKQLLGGDLEYGRFSEEGTVPRAVTKDDYENILSRSPFQPTFVHVEFSGVNVQVVVFRREGSYGEDEVKKMRAYLETYRMLTDQIKIRQTQLCELEPYCRVQLNPHIGGEGSCKKKIEAVFREALAKKKLGEPLNLADIRFKIMSVPEVRKLEELQVERGELENQFFEIKQLTVEFKRRSSGEVGTYGKR